MANSKESFKGTIDLIKSRATEYNTDVTNEQLADKLNITIDQLITFYNNDSAPDGLFPLLRLHFDDFLKGASVHNISISQLVDPGDEDFDLPPLDPKE